MKPARHIRRDDSDRESLGPEPAEGPPDVNGEAARYQFWSETVRGLRTGSGPPAGADSVERIDQLAPLGEPA